MFKLPINFKEFKSLLFTAYDEWDYSSKQATKYASEIIIEDLYNKHELAGVTDFKIDEIDLMNTLISIGTDILNGKKINGFKIDSEDPTNFEVTLEEN